MADLCVARNFIIFHYGPTREQVADDRMYLLALGALSATVQFFSFSFPQADQERFARLAIYEQTGAFPACLLLVSGKDLVVPELDEFAYFLWRNLSGE